MLLQQLIPNQDENPFKYQSPAQVMALTTWLEGYDTNMSFKDILKAILENRPNDAKIHYKYSVIAVGDELEALILETKANFERILRNMTYYNNNNNLTH